MNSYSISNRLCKVARSYSLRQRMFATDTAPVAVTKPVANKGGGMFGGLFQRISSFFVGAGLTALGTHYLIFEELRKSNALMIVKQKQMEDRLLKLEKK